MTRTRGLLVVILLAVAIGVPAQEETFAAPWAAPVPDVRDGAMLIGIGFWADAIGLGLVAGSSAAFGISAGAGATLFELGVISMLLVGNPTLQLGLQAHHDALAERGIAVSDEYQIKSRRFGVVSLACAGGSILLSIGALAADSWELGIAALLVGTTGVVFEIFNFYGHRLNWANDMRQAAGIAIR